VILFKKVTPAAADYVARKSDEVHGGLRFLGQLDENYVFIFAPTFICHIAPCELFSTLREKEREREREREREKEEKRKEQKRRKLAL